MKSRFTFLFVYKYSLFGPPICYDVLLAGLCGADMPPLPAGFSTLHTCVLSKAHPKTSHSPQVEDAIESHNHTSFSYTLFKSIIIGHTQPRWATFNTMWNSRSPCGAESVAERRSSHCWSSWLALDKENHWQSKTAVGPDGWVQWALHNPSICCSQSPLDGAAQKDLGIKSSQAVTHPTICGAKPCLTSMITWQALYPRPFSFSL